jgi:hypothetical protein
MPLAQQADSIVLRTDEYETKARNAWRSDDREPIYTRKSGDVLGLSGFDFYEDLTHEERVSFWHVSIFFS